MVFLAPLAKAQAPNVCEQLAQPQALRRQLGSHSQARSVDSVFGVEQGGQHVQVWAQHAHVHPGRPCRADARGGPDQEADADHEGSGGKDSLKYSIYIQRII